MTRSGAIILDAGRVALIERRREGELYYLFPGGGVEEGETAVEAMVREVREELGLEVEAGRLVAQVLYRGKTQLFFLADVRGGRFGAGDGPEMNSLTTSERGSYVPVWLEVQELRHSPVYPGAVVDMVVAAADRGWPLEALVVEDRGRERQASSRSGL